MGAGLVRSSSNRGREGVMKSQWLLLCLLVSAMTASAHVNDRGMDYKAFKDRYGQSCCDHRDCRPAADFIETVVDGKPVVRLLIDGTWITVAHAYVVARRASDGRAHFCGKLHFPGSNPAQVKPEPTCVILPPRDV
jgi:hypothetical protein